MQINGRETRVFLQWTEKIGNVLWIVGLSIDSRDRWVYVIRGPDYLKQFNLKTDRRAVSDRRWPECVRRQWRQAVKLLRTIEAA